MKKLLTLALLTSALFFNQISYAISGPSSGCLMNSYWFADTLSPGGTWSSSNPSIATINSSSGLLYCVSVGTVTISYVSGSSVTTTSFTVNDWLPEIVGPDTVCGGATALFTNPVAGGTWSSTNPSAISIDAISGLATGGSGGYANISYDVAGYCSNYHWTTVPWSTTDTTDLGPLYICLGGTSTYTCTASGGVWSSSNPAVANVDALGNVTGVSAGGAFISYVTTGVCGITHSYVQYVTVTSTTFTGSIYGSDAVTAGNTVTLYSTIAGGTWASSNPSIATINPTSGEVTGVTAGTVTISYTVSGCSGTASTTFDITVYYWNGISGNVYFTGVPYVGMAKVWLIDYVTPTLTAVDSQYIWCSGASAHYEFPSVPAGSYRVKARAGDTTGVATTGYMPTYFGNTFYWSTASVIAHASAGCDVLKNIDMMYGSYTSGLGFIAGDVTTGANKGTTGGVPVNGMLMFILDASNNLYQSIRTDATGHYSFSNLPYGTYYVFPDSLNYATTPYTSIVLSASGSSYSAASFIQHTLSKTITPIPVAINNVTGAEASVVMFPNPTTGKVNIAWQLPVAEEATVLVTDVTGKVVYSTVMGMTQGAGSSQLNLSALSSGLYNLSIKSASVNYINKVQVQH